MNVLGVVVNGRSTSVQRGSTVADLISQLTLSMQMVVVEYNGDPLSRDEFSSTVLGAGDAIEIAQMVGGG
ncbi:MAG TPA: sulfur carrier protein ThiS [Candidatus Eremiobacteraceae bacterium]